VKHFLKTRSERGDTFRGRGIRVVIDRLRFSGLLDDFFKLRLEGGTPENFRELLGTTEQKCFELVELNVRYEALRIER